jgi:ATP synthase protein I
MSLTNTGRQLAKRVIFLQSLLALFIAVLFFFLWEDKMSVNVALSAVLGGLICIIPYAIFSFFAFKFAGGSKNRLVVKSFSQGLKLKLFSAIVLFTVVYKWEALIPLVLLVSYIVVLLSQWPIIIFLHRSTNK